MNIEMKNRIPTYNAKIGSEFDDASVKLKSKNSKYTKSYITFLALGAVFADLTGVIDSRISITLAVVFTLISLFTYWQKKSGGFTEQWTYTRVVAESFKSEWFKFAVGGGDYPIKDNLEEIYFETEFKKKLNKFYDEYKKSMHEKYRNYLEYVDLDINKETLAIRNESLDQRLEYYKKNRMYNQMKWYEKKSQDMKWYQMMYTRLFRFVLFIGIVIGGVMVANSFNWISIPFLQENDLFSIAIAVGFALDGINSADQYERLGIAYEKSFNELSDAIRELEDDKNDIKTNEKVFSEFVEDIENKISSEHKSWSLTTSSKNIH